MVRRDFITPSDLPEEKIQRCLLIPASQEWLGLINAALLFLTESWRYEQLHETSLTPDETAAAAYAIYVQYLSGECEGFVPCEVPADPDLGITINIRIIRRGAGGHTQELIGDMWQTPTGDYEVPPVPERTEPTPQDRRCLAAANAAHVLELIYEEATDAWNVEHTTAAVFGAIFDAAILLIGAFAGPTAAAYASLGKTAFDAFVETVDTLASDVWTSAFTDELTCFLYNESTDTDGVVTFDWTALRNGITEKFLEAGAQLDTDKALLWGQVGYLFDILAAGGIDHAGTTTAITEYDCTDCGIVDWCYHFDFALSNGGWEAATEDNPPGTYGTYVAGTGWRRTGVSGGGINRRAVMIRKQVTEPTQLTKVTVEVSGLEWGSIPSGTVSRFAIRAGETILVNVLTGFPDFPYTWEGNVTIPDNQYVFIQVTVDYRTSGTPVGDVFITDVTMEGTALIPPFGEDNC